MFRQLAMLLIFMLRRVINSILPLETPSSWFWISDNVDPMWTRNFLSETKAFIKFGSLPFNPLLCWSFMIPYFQVVSYAYSRSKNIVTRCRFWMFASLIEDSYLTIRSIVDLWHCESIKRLLDSINQTNLLLTIRSIVLQRQLVNSIGL